MVNSDSIKKKFRKFVKKAVTDYRQIVFVSGHNKEMPCIGNEKPGYSGFFDYY
jgi:hypothetical protein